MSGVLNSCAATERNESRASIASSASASRCPFSSATAASAGEVLGEDHVVAAVTVGRGRRNDHHHGVDAASAPNRHAHEGAHPELFEDAQVSGFGRADDRPPGIARRDLFRRQVVVGRGLAGSKDARGAPPGASGWSVHPCSPRSSVKRNAGSVIHKTMAGSRSRTRRCSSLVLVQPLLSSQALRQIDPRENDDGAVLGLDHLHHPVDRPGRRAGTLQVKEQAFGDLLRLEGREVRFQ